MHHEMNYYMNLPIKIIIKCIYITIALNGSNMILIAILIKYYAIYYTNYYMNNTWINIRNSIHVTI